MRKIITLCPLVLALSLLAAQSPPDSRNEKGRTVTIKDLKYDPAKLTIKKGETVTWHNTDDNDHTVTSDEKGLFASENMPRGDKFRHTFPKAGRFAYHCKYHPRMKGTIVVE